MIKVICFHNPDEINGYLSNWFISDFDVNEMTFTSMEKYMMYQKTITFNDYQTAAQIIDTDNVGKIKALGRSVKGYEDVVWNGVRQISVRICI